MSEEPEAIDIDARPCHRTEVWFNTSFPVYLAGRDRSREPWAVLGVYPTREQAEARCQQRCDFVMELKLGEDLERVLPQPAERCRFPLVERSPG